MSAPAKSSSIAVKLKRKRLSTDYDGPLLVRFPHGPPAQLMKSELAEDIQFQLHAHTEERKVNNKLQHTTHTQRTNGSARCSRYIPFLSLIIVPCRILRVLSPL